MVKTSRRIEQINDFLRNEIANLIQEERDELRLKLVSVTEVQTSPDLRHARVYISTLGGEKERDAAVETLRRHARHLRHLLAPRITFRSVPELDFRADASL
ncbi:MAG: 30S ribosome-binding factor RbfA [Thermomicrobia bacterium]|nr:30S ribosome-binding factor RbfA [Thermomicrobia bacterium]